MYIHIFILTHMYRCIGRDVGNDKRIYIYTYNHMHSTSTYALIDIHIHKHESVHMHEHVRKTNLYIYTDNCASAILA